LTQTLIINDVHLKQQQFLVDTVSRCGEIAWVGSQDGFRNQNGLRTTGMRAQLAQSPAVGVSFIGKERQQDNKK
jgi:hypothetical protein